MGSKSESFFDAPSWQVITCSWASFVWRTVANKSIAIKYANGGCERRQIMERPARVYEYLVAAVAAFVEASKKASKQE